MSKILEKDGPEEIVYEGRMIEIVNQPMKKGDKKMTFEWGQRAPGVRVVAIDADERILLTREHRYEHDDYDYRLPGGKVVDSLEDWHSLKDVEAAALKKAIEEGREEAGIAIGELKPIEVVPDGATFKWDLHYFETRDFEIVSQELEHGEDISVGWYTKAEVLDLIKNKKIGEGRSVYILMPYLLD